MIKTKQIDAILSVYNSEGESSNKLNAIASISISPKNKVISIFLDPNLNLDEKLEKIHTSVSLTEKTIRKYRKMGQYIGTACLIVYSLLQTIGLI